MTFEENLKKNNVKLPKAADPVGSYVATKIIGKMLFVSGQIPLDPKTMELVDGIENQVRQVFQNIESILEAAEMNFSNVVKLSVLLDDLSNFELVNKIMSEIFLQPYPARAAYQVSKLPKGSSIEIETIAFKE